jgi:hypothetical protein
VKTTRILVVAILTAASVFVPQAVQAQQAGIKRTDVQRHDLDVPGREVIQVRVDFAPGGRSASTHIRVQRSLMSLKVRSSISSMTSHQ